MQTGESVIASFGRVLEHLLLPRHVSRVSAPERAMFQEQLLPKQSPIENILLPRYVPLGLRRAIHIYDENIGSESLQSSAVSLDQDVSNEE
jgi:hypothetical protein